jgi:hypothetical protein
MKFCSALIVNVIALAAIGCGGGKSPVPGSGTVTHKGQPVADATVLFTPVGAGDAAGMMARGTTDAQGKFSLTTNKPNDGVVPGDYRVSVSPKTKERPEGDYSADPPPPFPQKYTDPTATDLKVTVKSGGSNDFPLELKD